MISFVDGKPYKTLKRHLSGHDLTFDGCLERFGLPRDYPSVVVSYSETHSALTTEHRPRSAAWSDGLEGRGACGDPTREAKEGWLAAEGQANVAVRKIRPSSSVGPTPLCLARSRDDDPEPGTGVRGFDASQRTVQGLRSDALSVQTLPDRPKPREAGRAVITDPLRRIRSTPHPAHSSLPTYPKATTRSTRPSRR